MLNVLLPVAGVTAWIPGLVLFGLGVGFLVGMFGVGGGFIMTPMLHAVFGIPYPVAVGSSLLQIFLNSGVAVLRHRRAGNVDFKLGLVLAAGGLGGTEVGVRLLSILDQGGEVLLNGRALALLDLLMNLLFLVLLGCVAVLVVRETAGAENAPSSSITAAGRWVARLRLRPLLSFPRSGIESYSLFTPLLIGFCVGVLTGLMGVGGGFLNFPILVYIVGVPTAVAVGTSAFQVLFAGAFGAGRHLLLGNVELLLVAIMFAGSFGGVQLGAWVVGRLRAHRIRRYFSIVLGIGILIILWDLGRRIWL